MRVSEPYVNPSALHCTPYTRRLTTAGFGSAGGLTIQSFGVMRRGQLTGGLHVRLQVPEHAQADVRDVDDVGAQGDRGLGVYAIDALRSQGLDEARQVLVQREQAQQLGRRLPIRLRLAVGGLGGSLIVGDGLRVEVAYLEDVDGYPPARRKQKAHRQHRHSPDATRFHGGFSRLSRL